MTASEPKPLLRRAEDIDYEAVDAAEGMKKGVLVGPEHGAPNLAIRRFVLEAGAEVPKHTNDIEHEQYVLEGKYVVGISEASETPRANGEAVSGDEEHTVSAGDSLLIPAGTVHWYRNESDQQGSFICAVPTGDDSIELVDE
ncbi:cupin domain-containing protein [Natronomonas halophila]|uniref:cupin domain-containing protein n=1 Tax=Natronomonas halophila TaxID=2747817 RepID=UPI0015B56118|nr:cupin domain-containing protein [Natronomonas halophila]QLD85269.1 cupin domain-containing protein [Natronomonas halophila]